MKSAVIIVIIFVLISIIYVGCTDETYDIYDDAQKIIINNLDDMNEISFPEYSEDVVSINIDEESDTVIVSSFYLAKNAMGVPVKPQYSVEIKYLAGIGDGSYESGDYIFEILESGE